MDGDIELEIGAGSGANKYAVRVVRAAAGGEPIGTLDLDVAEVLSRRDLLEATVLASTVPRRAVPVTEQPVREVGRLLFQALFTGPVYGVYRACLGVAQQRGKRLRVVLRLTAPELAALPWETLFDPEAEEYLCRREPLVRHVPAPFALDPLEVRLPLRILGIVASPLDLPRLDVAAEKAYLAKALARPVADGLVKVSWVPEATWEGVHDQLLDGEWHVLHFVGHGDYDTQAGEGVLALVGDDGRADLVQAGRLADLLGEAQPTPRLVVLNSCSSGEIGAHDLFSGTAAALVRSGISAVAAMQYAVSDTGAIAFSRGFYTALAHGRSVDEAARSGRISILGANSLEWVTPVLYVRGQEAQLFTLTTPPLPPLVADDGDSPDDQDIPEYDRRLVETYALAVEAEDDGDWVTAARRYDKIMHADPAYRDAAARKGACEARQRVANLQAELRHCADACQWQDVLDFNAELTRLDPSSSDPGGLATRARATLDAENRAAGLQRRYARARAAEDRGDWTAAIHGYDEILGIDPAYQDATGRREACRDWVTRRPRPAKTLVLGPLILCIPVFFIALHYFGPSAKGSWRWIILLTAALGIAVSAAEYRRSRIWALALGCNFAWCLLYLLYGLKLSHTGLRTANFSPVLYGIATIANLSLCILAIIRLRGTNRTGMHPLLPVFLGCMAIGLSVESA